MKGTKVRISSTCDSNEMIERIMEHVGVYYIIFIENIPHDTVLLAIILHMKELWLREAK